VTFSAAHLQHRHGMRLSLCDKGGGFVDPVLNLPSVVLTANAREYMEPTKAEADTHTHTCTHTHAHTHAG
jgi:hypothetical protein